LNSRLNDYETQTSTICVMLILIISLRLANLKKRKEENNIFMCKL